MAKQAHLLVGTTKGAFFFHADEKRRDWRLTGPHLAGWEVYSLLGDSRRGDRIYAGTNHYVYGPTVRISDDLGETWYQVEASPRYTKESGHTLKRIWQLEPGHASEPETVWAGVDEAGLFVSRNRGESWEEILSLTSHPTRPAWFPGNGGLCLHTILVDPADPRRMWVGISAVGIFRTEDAGETWTPRNEGIPVIPVETADPTVCRCPHKLVLNPDDSDTLYLQYHGGVLRSTDGADSWQPIEQGLPGNFGFPIVVTAAGDLFVVPLDEEHRCVWGGDLRVYRSRDRGESWQPLENGLPEQPTYVGVLRDAMATDSLEPAGVYFGTTMGEVYCSPDAGESWTALPGMFPRITCVRTWVTGG